MTGGAQNPPKQVRFDFTFIHALNASVFFQSIKSLPYITTSDKVRLLEWKVRCDILMYAAHNAPKLVLSPIMSYEDERDWRTMFDIMIRHPNEDVHTAKTLRAIANGQRICAPFEKGGRERGFFVVDSMWIKMANLRKSMTPTPAASGQCLSRISPHTSFEVPSNVDGSQLSTL